VAECCFEQLNEFFEVAAVQIVVDQFFQFFSLNDDLNAANLSQTKLLSINTSETDLDANEQEVSLPFKHTKKNRLKITSFHVLVELALRALSTAPW
jgi:hypothetical protein